MKRVLSFLLTSIIILSSLPLSALQISASPFAGGDGSEGNPYLVATPEALDAVRDNLTAHYKQVTDIDMSAVDNWVPISRFEGVYDGGNYKISNFSLNDFNFKITEDQDYVGLFAYLCNSTVMNVNLDDLNISLDISLHDYKPQNEYSSLSVGGLCATADNTQISNCSVSGNITIKNCSYLDIGGFASSLYDGSGYSTIENCTSNCNITVIGKETDIADGSRYIFCGGLLGTNNGSLINECSNTGNILIKTEGHCYAGGIVGSSYGNPAFLSCVNRGNITVEANCNAFIGGICSRTSAGTLNDDIVFIACSNSGSISASIGGAANIGGIAGVMEGSDRRKNAGGVTNSQNIGEINVTMTSAVAEAYVGGIVGNLKAAISRAVNYGNILLLSEKSDNSQIFVGGICGKEIRPDTSTITRPPKYCIEYCYNLSDDVSARYWDTTTIAYTSTNVGRILGNDDALTECYSNKETLVNSAIRYGSLTTDKNGGDLTADKFIIEETYKTFDFEDDWIIDKNIGGAVLRGVPLDASPADPDAVISAFNEFLYRADHLTSGNMNMHSDLAIHNWLLTNYYSPSKILVDSHPDGMHTVAAAWEAMQGVIDATSDGPAVAYKSYIKQQDIITSYILAAVGTYTEVQYVDAVKDNYKHVNNLVKFTTELNDTFVAAGGDFRDFAKDRKGTLASLLTEYYDENDPTMSKLLKTEKGMNLLGSVIDKANDFEDLYNKLSTYSKLYALNDSTKDALNLMYEICPDEASTIKKSLADCAEIINSANEEMITDIIEREVAVALTEEAAYVFSEKFTKYVTDICLKSCPLAESFIQYAKLQMTVVDKMLGIDARTEQYFRMCAFTELDRVAGLAVQQAIMDYKDNRTTDNAATLLAAVELKFGFIDQDFKEAIKYSEIIFDAGVMTKIRNSLLEIFGLDLVNTLKDSLLEAEKAKNILYCTVATSWLIPLEAEDPDTARKYHDYRNKIYTIYHPEIAEYFVSLSENADKAIYVHCPVNISVYDTSGKLVAEVCKDEVWADGGIAVIYDHGGKEIYFFDGTDHTIVCEGYDAGDMDIEVIDYDSDGNVVHRVNYNNVPVTSGSMHSLSSDSVSDSSGNTIECDYDSANTDAARYKVSIKNGTIAGYLFESDAAKGEKIEISAIIPEGYRFVGWQASGGEVVFEDEKASSTSFFMPEGDVEISAKLKKIEKDDPDEKKQPEGPSVIFIIIAVVAVLICIIGGTILFVMIKEKRKKEN